MLLRTVWFICHYEGKTWGHTQHSSIQGNSSDKCSCVTRQVTFMTETGTRPELTPALPVSPRPGWQNVAAGANVSEQGDHLPSWLAHYRSCRCDHSPPRWWNNLMLSRMRLSLCSPDLPTPAISLQRRKSDSSICGSRGLLSHSHLRGRMAVKCSVLSER